METVSINGSLAATYSYNPLGQRVLKTLANATKEIYHYDQSGQLIAVTDGAGTTLREYIYWGNQQIAFTNTVQGQSIAAQTLDEANVIFQGAHVIATTNAGYTGSGFIDYVGEGSASWSVNAPATASYNLTLRYGLSGADRPLVLKVDGNTIATINFVSSPLWTTWKTKTVTLNLTAGQHTIALHTSGLSGPNVDKVDLAAVNPVTTTSTSLYYIHSDHLNTPQVITNQNQQVVWMGNYEPFGKLAANANNSIEIFSRFPGQYVDPETGLYYNYFRDYDPSIGRYIESDPIGLEGRINTYAYAYVGGNPGVNSDPFGLQSVRVPGIPIPLPWIIPLPGNSEDSGSYDPANPYDGDPTVLPGSMESRSGGGSASTPRPHSHGAENAALGFPPGGNCDDLNHAIKILEDMIAWRKSDLNLAHVGTQTYVDHQKRIRLLREQKQRLEKERDSRWDCKPDCLSQM